MYSLPVSDLSTTFNLKYNRCRYIYLRIYIYLPIVSATPHRVVAKWHSVRKLWDRFPRERINYPHFLSLVRKQCIALGTVQSTTAVQNVLTLSCFCLTCYMRDKPCKTRTVK